MSKKLPKKFKSEDAVKRALKIDSLNKLTKDESKKLALMIPYMDKEVAIVSINQLSQFVDFGKIVISSYMQICDSILEKNKESQIVVIQGYQTILNVLSRKMEVKDITDGERKSITEDMILVADKIAQADLQNKNFISKVVTKLLLAFGLVTIIIAGLILVVNEGGRGIPLDTGNDDEETST